MNITVMGPDGKPIYPEGGCYGIGVSRVVGALIEANHDEAGIIWPESVAPFDIAIANLQAGDAATDAACENLYGKMTAAGLDVLYDDRDDRPGAKFATMDLIGVPVQIIVGPKALAEGKVEVKHRRTGERELLSLEEVVNKFAAKKG
jgi:prolyl-tRNA synthetase